MPTDTPQNNPRSSERPTWLPEGYDSPEAFRKSWDDDRARIGDLEKRSESLKAWEKWGDPADFERNLVARIQKRDADLRAAWEKERGTQQPRQQDQANDPYANYWELSPREQAALQAKIAGEQVMKQVTDLINQRWSEAQTQLNSTDQRFSLLSRALSEKARNPDLDLNQLWKEANTLATGDQNQLFDLAAERVMSPTKIKKQIEDAVAAAKVEWDAAEKARQQAALVGSNHGATTNSFKDTLEKRKAAKSDTERRQSIRERVLEKAVMNGEIHPAQV